MMVLLRKLWLDRVFLFALRSVSYNSGTLLALSQYRQREDNMKNLFWHVYQNLEKELLEIGDTVLVVDKQLDVYSVRIAELLVRTCVEIESIAKELYFANGGPKYREQHPYFDRDCLGYLNEQWKLSKKKVAKRLIF